VVRCLDVDDARRTLDLVRTGPREGRSTVLLTSCVRYDVAPSEPGWSRRPSGGLADATRISR
jgi:hypothetical protein